MTPAEMLRHIMRRVRMVLHGDADCNNPICPICKVCPTCGKPKSECVNPFHPKWRLILNLFFPLDCVNCTQEAINFSAEINPKWRKWYKIIVQRRKKNRFYVPQPIEDLLKGVIECNCKVQKSIVCFLLLISLSWEKNQHFGDSSSWQGSFLKIAHYRQYKNEVQLFHHIQSLQVFWSGRKSENQNGTQKTKRCVLHTIWISCAMSLFEKYWL
jgi:hypothetical protein